MAAIIIFVTALVFMIGAASNEIAVRYSIDEACRYQHKTTQDYFNCKENFWYLEGVRDDK